MLSDQQLERYQAQLFLPEVDIEGQLQLLAKKVLVVGAGGLGNHLLPTLAGAGVGQILLYDPDVISLSNLPRQWLYRPADLGLPKVEVCARFIGERFSDCRLWARQERFDEQSLAQLPWQPDLLLDCSDHLPTRLLLNDWALKQGLPLVTASAIGLQGQILLHDPRQQAGCWRCLFSDVADQPLACSQAGVLASVVQQVAAMQAQLALHQLLAWPQLPVNLWRYQGQLNQWRSLRVPLDPACSAEH